MAFGLDIIHGSGNVQTRNYDITNFRSVKLAGFGNLSVQQTGEESIHIEADDNLFDYLRVELHGDELYLGLVNNVILRSPHTLKFNVTVKNIEGISISGSGQVDTSNLSADHLRMEISGSGDLDTGALNIEKGFKLKISGSGKAEIQSVKSDAADVVISGSGKIRIDEIQTQQATIHISGSGDVRVQKLETETIETRISGSGDIELEGKTESQELSISSAGKYQCANLESDRANIHISGVGSAKVFVKERLDVRISGSGSVHYRGRPVVISSNSGAGKVKSLEQKVLFYRASTSILY